MEAAMGQALFPLALVVEDDADQRDLLTTLLEESDMRVFPCKSAEAAIVILDRVGSEIALLITDVELAGMMDGTELARRAKARFPHMSVIVTSGRDLPTRIPADATFFPKPWRALDVLREAERAHQ
jgi:DNA-binding NtrC family response regulator